MVPAHMWPVIVVMPVFNEEGAVTSFLQEIHEAFHPGTVGIIVVDDASTDQTMAELQRLVSEGKPITILANEQNSGHGYSTLKALRYGAGSAKDVVVAVDGDGAISGAQVWQLAEASKTSGMVIEGVRRQRDDPIFRKLTTLVTRGLVWLVSGKLPRDANTPFRAYPPAILHSLLREIPAGTAIPNIFMSEVVRQSKVPFLELHIPVTLRDGALKTGATWNQNFAFLPSRRFLSFTLKAILDWASGRAADRWGHWREILVRRVFGRNSIGRYGIVGLSGLLLDLFFFWVLVTLGLQPALATAVSTLVGISNNYVLNSLRNFHQEVNIKSGIRFLTVGLIGLGVSVASVSFLVEAGASSFSAKLITVPVVVLLQFLFNYTWTFRANSERNR